MRRPRPLFVAIALVALLVSSLRASIVTITPIIWQSGGPGVTSTGITINAVGESSGSIGYLHLQGQTGSKTCSSAGCVIYWTSASGTTWLSASTNVKVGIQDVTTATGLEDGTFDVRADLVPGTETIANNSLNATAMETGSKTMAHGDLIAIVIEMTARGGTDAFSVDRIGARLEALTAVGFPYSTNDTGTLAKGAVNNEMATLIKFDDGTFGWIDEIPLTNNSAAGDTLQSFNSGSTPDEYAAVFKVPLRMSITAIGAKLTSVATTDTFEMLLYTDPLGSPSVVRTWAPDPDGLVTGGMLLPAISPYTLEPNTYYAIAVRPTSTNNITWSYFDLTSSTFEVLKRPLPFTAAINAARTDQTGAFVETQSYHLPYFAIAIGGIDATSAGGGTGTPTSWPFVGPF